MERLTPRVVDETEFGFGWISPEHPRVKMTSHAVVADDGVWLIDPTDAPSLDDRVRELGEPRAVVQLLNRHNRGCATVSARLGVPHHRVPFAGVPGSPFEFVHILSRLGWDEVALWWAERRVLVTADALGTVPHYFALAGEPLGVHPLLRLTPPRRLAAYEPDHVLVGHGEGVHVDATAAVRAALDTARRRLLRLPGELLSVRRRRAPA